MLEVLGYENLESEDLSDANWLNVNISLEVGKFSSRYRASLTTQSFLYFENELKNVYDKLDGMAVFTSDEEELELAVELSSGGRGVVSGKAKSFDWPKVEVMFQFETDQTFLKETLSDLREISQSFPVITQNV